MSRFVKPAMPYECKQSARHVDFQLVPAHLKRRKRRRSARTSHPVVFARWGFLVILAHVSWPGLGAMIRKENQGCTRSEERLIWRRDGCAGLTCLDHRDVDEGSAGHCTASRPNGRRWGNAKPRDWFEHRFNTHCDLLELVHTSFCMAYHPKITSMVTGTILSSL